MASRCSTVFVEPPMAMSRAMAFMNAGLVAMERGSTEASPCPYHRSAICTIRAAAASKRPSLLSCVATTVPLPGRAMPSASVRQFMELAVNMPEQLPHVGQAAASMAATSASLTDSSAAATIASTRS